MKRIGKDALFAPLVAITHDCSELRQDVPVLRSIMAAAPPAKTVYRLGETLDLTGLIVIGTYSDGVNKQDPISQYRVTGYNPAAIGAQALTVTMGDETAALEARVVETVSVNAIADYLVKASGGEAVNDPVQLAVDVNLANEGWSGILASIGAAGKYVALDLSACATNRTEFDPVASGGAELIAALVLPATARSIKAGTSGNSPFKAFTSLASISAVGVETVGTNIFRDCESLVSVSLPMAYSIGDWAFRGCTRLASMNLPASLAAIDGNPFAGCTNLASITVDSANTLFSARGGVLLDKAGTTLIAYPSAAGDIMLPSLIAVGGEAFRNCTSLRSVSLPAAASIGRAAFCGCASLRSVSLPAAASVGCAAFYDCESLGSVSLPAAASIGGEAFYGCTNLASVNLPVATYIGRGAFSGCTSLASVSLPAATDIGGEAFYGCARLGSADLPVAASIGDYAFSDCANLAFMNLPASLAAIDGNPFAGCTNLASIIVDSANTVFSARGGVLLDKAGITLIAYPSAAGDIMLPSLIAVGGEAFQNCTSLRSVSLPAAADIGRAAFCDCANLRSVNLPAAASIGRAVFYGCTRLGSVSLPAAASIDGAAFRDCESLESVSLSAAADIGDEAFYGCTSLRSVSLPLTPPSIGYNIFSATGSTGAIVASVPVGAVSAYISAWGVSASTPTGGNESVYGSDSKAVYITDASWRSASIDSFQGNALRSAALSPLWEIYQF